MMDDRIVVPRLADDASRADAVSGWYVWRQRVYVVCEGCGVAGSLGSHEVAADGVVSPSVACDCGWHMFVRLEDWPYGFKAAGVLMDLEGALESLRKSEVRG